MPSHVFISYAHADGNEFARKLHADLMKLGVSTWLDAHQIPPGSDWDTEIDKGLTAANAVVVLLTPNAVKSIQVRSEWNRALKQKLVVVPLLVLTCEVPRVLEMLQYIDFRQKKDYKAGFKTLTAILKQQPTLWEDMGSSVRTTQKTHPSASTLVPGQPQSVASEKIRVVIVDDHKMVTQGMMVMLENFDDFEIVETFLDARAAIDFCRKTVPDVVLMDMVMPIMDGVTATRLIREASPNTQVIVITSFSEDDNVQNALQAGAISYLMKNVSGDELANAIRYAHAGKSTLAPEAAQVLIRSVTRPPVPGHDLTERERAVLALMIEGLNNREIAERLIISSSTVKNQVSNILDKLGTVSRTQAVALAVEHKIIG